MINLKICDICGTFNLKENNYCTHCGSRFVIEHVCPFCGEVNPDISSYCIKCKKQINPLAIDDFDILFNEYNEHLLKTAQITNDEYNEILSNIERYTKLESKIENLVYSSVQSYIEDLENMEKIDNIIELMKALFIGEYMSDSADRFWGDKSFSYSDKLKQAMHRVDYLDFNEQVHEYEEDCSNGETITYKKHRWLIGKIDEISKVCEEQYKDMQDENTCNFEDYWLNGEVLIVKMVNGRLTAKVR